MLASKRHDRPVRQHGKNRVSADGERDQGDRSPHRLHIARRPHWHVVPSEPSLRLRRHPRTRAFAPMRWCRRITVRTPASEVFVAPACGWWCPGRIGPGTGDRVYGSAEPMVHSSSTVTLGPPDRVGIKAPGAIPRRWSHVARADKWAIALYVAIPVLMGVPPALVGRPLFPGSGTADNLTQNYPLRVLSGELLRHGGLPLWDPYIWSGTPLLAGWNAGALYPGTWLFAVLPASWAFTVNVASVSIVCAAGMHVFLRRLGCSPLAAVLGVLTFTYTGFMWGQAVHLGLVIGMSFTPWMLLAVHELGTSPEPREARRWAALLGGCGGLVVLAGDPRAASSIAFIVITYFLAICWRAWRTGRRVNVAECRRSRGRVPRRRPLNRAVATRAQLPARIRTRRRHLHPLRGRIVVVARHRAAFRALPGRRERHLRPSGLSRFVQPPRTELCGWNRAPRRCLCPFRAGVTSAHRREASRGLVRVDRGRCPALSRLQHASRASPGGHPALRGPAPPEP